MSENPAKEISLIDSLSGGCLSFPIAAMSDVGPATQTLAGLLKTADQETHQPASEISRYARVPLKTYRRHVDLLHERGWIENCGPQYNEDRKLRHTCTLKVTAKTRTAQANCGILPWWAGGIIRTVWEGRIGRRPSGRMPWSAKAVFSIVMARLKTAPNFVERGYWSWSIEEISLATGLHGESIVKAKRWLANHLIINWYSTKGNFGGSGRHILEPSERFRVVETPTGEEGKVYLDFVKIGLKSGIG